MTVPRTNSHMNIGFSLLSVEIKKAHHAIKCGVPAYLSERISDRVLTFRKLQKRLDNPSGQSFNTTQRWPPK
jgi:hypothetical protein